MEVHKILPILILFFVWGAKPGPHTITLIFWSISHGTRAGVAIAIGNNLCHLVYFWSVFLALHLFTLHSTLLTVVRLVSAIYIIGYAVWDIWTTRVPAENIDRKGILASIASGFVVGLMNPLNASFYLAVVPELQDYKFTTDEVLVVSFVVFFALLSGQFFYIAFADIMRRIVEDPVRRRMLLIVSNILFAGIGVYIIAQVVSQMSAS